MGVRIAAYAVDVPSLEVFLAQSIGRVLQYVAEHATDREVVISWCEPNRGRIQAVPGEAVFRVKQAPKAYRPQVIREAAFSRDPSLLQVAADVLRAEGSPKLRDLLRALSRCPANGRVKTIAEGHRRWWIGSLLDFADQNCALEPDEYDRFVLLWQKMLRGYDCGKWLPPATFERVSFDFPVIPSDDTDPMMGVWTDQEARFVAEWLDRILKLGPRFKAPPWCADTSVNSEDYWDKWVREMIGRFLVVQDPRGFCRLAVVSFIG